MASKYKNPSDVELVAIYRLEFYRKQKNWKFCQDVCKKKAPVLAPKPDESSKGSVKSTNSAKSVLNKTYNLDPELDPPDLNNAFMEPDPDKIPPVTPPDPINLQSLKSPHKTEPNTSHPESQQKWPDQQQQWQESEQQWLESEQQWHESEQQWLESEQQWPESEQQWPESEEQWPEQEKKWLRPQQQWPEADRVWSVPEMPEQVWQNARQELGGEGAYYPQHVDSLRAFEMDRGWPEPCAEADIAYVEEKPEAVLGAAEAWLLQAPGAQPAARADEDTRSSLSTESMISFMRGAAAAPHSSEVDLNVTGSSASQLSERSAASLAPRALAAAVRAHAAALRVLLRAQDRPRSTLSVDYRTPNAFNLTFEDRPTRDIDLFHPHKDSFIAGSFKNEPTGRGRGRLHRERLIGIGMGRPYRL